jgi:hypothetical protein
MIVSGDMSRIAAAIKTMSIEVRNLLNSAIEISYFSRGAISYETVLQMSPLERELATDFINKRLEQASKSAFPVF